MPFVENYTYIGGLLRDAVIGYAEPLNESANHPDKSAVRPSITHECACSLSRAADFLREVEQKIADAKMEMESFMPLLDACSLG